jgi:3-oxoacyl-[acyl-carrier protein] reductase
MLLEGKTAIINGAGGAIGGAVARAFAREGATVYLAGRTLAHVEAVAKDISAKGGKAKAAEVDALDESAVERHVREVAAETNGIDILFNAIGTEDIQGSPLIDMPFDDFFKPIQKAARSQFLTACAVARHMVQRGKGVMLTITAGPPEAVENIGGFGPACQTIEGLWRGLAAELAPKGVRLICLRSAGSPDSPDFQEMVRQHMAVTGISRDAFLAELGKGTLLKRLPLLAEVADVAAMMASDRSSALTGTFIHVTCGSPAE